MNVKSAEYSTAHLPTADWTKALRPSMLYRFARLFGSNPNIISFAGGVPDPELIPSQRLAEAAAQTMTRDPGALTYGRDLPALKEHVQKLMRQRGVACSLDEINITAGGQHAMNVLTRVFLNHQGEVMLEELVYTGIQQAVMPFQPRTLTIPIDPAAGLDIDKIVSHLELGARPAFLYTIPEAHNPAGVTLSVASRQRLATVARNHRLPIIEDDAYGFLRYDGGSTDCLRALEPEWAIYQGSFSKILSPGLRLGWIVAPAHLAPLLQVTKQLSMLSIAPLSQHIVANFMAANDIDEHIEYLRQEYGRRRDTVLDAIEEHFPAEVEWTRPVGGFFIWVKLPQGIDTEELVFKAVEEEEVAYIPGRAFVTDPTNTRFDCYMRLGFARYAPEVLADGIARLGRVIKRVILEKGPRSIRKATP